jgi:type I restriction enzyme S subunit
MDLDIATVPLERGREYKVVGMLNRGRGLLVREAISASETTYKTLNRVRPDQVVYSRLKAFEGAITVAPRDLHEAYASHEFPTFTCAPALLPDYFRLLTTTDRLWSELQSVSTGMGGRRERVKPASFLTLKIALPPVAEQRRMVGLVAAVDAEIDALRDEAVKAWDAHALARTHFFLDAPRVSLTDICSMTRGLVDPLAAPYTDLIHVGIDSMEKDTGRIVGPRTAREDGLISGKYLFKRGDVIYSKIRPNLRKVSVPEFSGLCSADAYPLTPAEGLSPDLLREILLADEVVDAVVKMSGRTKMPKVNRRELFSISVPLPETSKRSGIDSALFAMRNCAEGLQAELSHLKSLRSALLSSLLSGEIQIPESFDKLLPKELAA